MRPNPPHVREVKVDRHGKCDCMPRIQQPFTQPECKPTLLPKSDCPKAYQSFLTQGITASPSQPGGSVVYETAFRPLQ